MTRNFLHELTLDERKVLLQAIIHTYIDNVNRNSLKHKPQIGYHEFEKKVKFNKFTNIDFFNRLVNYIWDHEHDYPALANDEDWSEALRHFVDVRHNYLNYRLADFYIQADFDQVLITDDENISYYELEAFPTIGDLIRHILFLRQNIPLNIELEEINMFARGGVLTIEPEFVQVI